MWPTSTYLTCSLSCKVIAISTPKAILYTLYWWALGQPLYQTPPWTYIQIYPTIWLSTCQMWRPWIDKELAWLCSGDYPEIWYIGARYLQHGWEWLSKGRGINCKGYLWIRVSRPSSTRLYSYQFLVNLVVKGPYLNPNLCTVVAICTVWSVTLTDLPRCPSITAPPSALYRNCWGR